MPTKTAPKVDARNADRAKLVAATKAKNAAARSARAADKAGVIEPDAVKHTRMSDADVTAAIKAAIKADASLANSWSRCLRTLRAEGKASGGHVRFRDLFVAVVGTKPAAKSAAKPAAKRAAAKSAAKSAAKPAAKRPARKSA